MITCLWLQIKCDAKVKEMHAREIKYLSSVCCINKNKIELILDMECIC